jgi:hypothetical protein
MHHRCARLQGFFHVHGGSERIILHHDEFQGIASGIAVGGHNHGHRLPDMTNLADSQRVVFG